jgi:carboxypeptidase Taq
VRLAVRFDPERITPSFFSFLHEGGHGIYFQGVPAEYRRTPLDGTTAQGANLSPVFGGIATSLHEGQSRLWENVLGRSHAFWVGFFPVLRRTFPSQTRGVHTEAWYRAINQVRLSHIRIAADELTYDLHIMLRFEIEAALVDGDLAVADLPAAWSELAVQYLGSAPDDLRQGPLQDIQWSRGGHGGFPSYTLGNVISMQLWSAMERELGSLDEAFAHGDYLPLRDWMRANVHSLGAAYAPREVLRRATGSADLDAKPYITYLKSKFGALYDGPDTRH